MERYFSHMAQAAVFRGKNVSADGNSAGGRAYTGRRNIQGRERDILRCVLDLREWDAHRNGEIFAARYADVGVSGDMMRNLFDHSIFCPLQGKVMD